MILQNELAFREQEEIDQKARTDLESNVVVYATWL